MGTTPLFSVGKGSGGEKKRCPSQLVGLVEKGGGGSRDRDSTLMMDKKLSPWKEEWGEAAVSFLIGKRGGPRGERHVNRLLQQKGDLVHL